MRIHKGSVAAATAVIGYNLISTEVDRVTGYDRLIVAYGMTGSTAIGDCEVVIKVGGAVKARIRNTALLLGIISTSMLADRIFVPRNVEIEVEVTVAANTNAIAFTLVTLP